MADSSLAELRKQCITSLYLCAENVSRYMDAEKEAEFEKLKSYVQEYCTQEAQEHVAIQALEKTRRETESSNIDNLEERFNNHLGSMSSNRINTNHPYMLEMIKRYQKGLRMAAQNLDESDIAITESQDQFIDPITKKAIVDPVKNNVCGHVYEKEAIMNLITMKPRSRCPVVGCANRGPITEANLLSDEELRFRMTINTHSTMIHERSVTNLDESTQ